MIKNAEVRITDFIGRFRKQLTPSAQKAWQHRERIFTVLAVCGVALTIILMYARSFLGTELTDEAYYVSEAKEMLNGNIPFAYNHNFKAVGFPFLLIPAIAFYKLFVPDLAGVFLFSRLCFVTYKVFVWAVVYNVMQRRMNKATALLISAMILPLNGPILNFSYNTVPELTFFMAGCLVYDVVEQDAPQKRARLILAGFMTGIAFFANPGWATALIIFTLLIAVRVKEKKEKTKHLLYYGCAVLAEVLAVVIPISIQTSFRQFCYGFYRMFISPIPVKPLSSDISWKTVLYSFKDASIQWMLFFIPITAVTYLILTKKPFILTKKPFRFGWKETGDDASAKRQNMIISVTAAMFIHSMYIILTKAMFLSYSGGGEIRAYVTFCYMIVFALIGAFHNEKIIWYLGTYQVIYTLAAIIFVTADANILRFINTYTVIIPLLYVLIRNRSAFVRILSGVLAFAVIVSLGYANFRRIYRDERFKGLKYTVQSGVYKGLRTTETRARDLPELESYLNSIIGEDETYAFRDNVQYGYLMVHKGRVCEVQTWDVLQYTRNRNCPSVLFDYYRVRDMIPDKIIYINHGTDDRLSIEVPGWKYNDWVNKYYDLVEEISLNETFFQILVYQYNGTFDGDYQWWIDEYWYDKSRTD